MVLLTVPFERTAPLILPQDISNEIIDYLQLDRTSLKSCSLVCRSWLFASRIHLFRKLVFTPKSVFLLPALISTPPCSTISPYVKTVELQGVGHLFGSDYVTSHLLCHFSLTLTHLRLHDITFDDFQCVLDVICTFPLLQILQLDHVYWGNAGNGQSGGKLENRVLPLSVEHLQLKNIDLQQFVPWLLSHPTLPMVSRIDFGPIEQKDIPYAGKYMALVGPKILHLSLSFGENGNEHICLFDLLKKQQPPKVAGLSARLTPAVHYKTYYGLSTCDHLSTFTSLQSLRIDGLLDVTSPCDYTATFWAPRIVASIKPNNLKHIVLGLNLSRAGDLDRHTVNWSYFDLVLSNDVYSHLRILEFEVAGRAQLDSVASLLAIRLPTVSSRGILRISKAV